MISSCRRRLARRPLITVAALGCACLLVTVVVPQSGSPASATDRTVATAASVRPNIVLVLTDDQTAGDMRYMQRTRSLLGQAGATFTDFVSPHPLCCPARAEILSGQYGHNNGVHHNSGPWGGWQALDAKSDTLGRWLRQSGYHTALVGKFLNGYEQTPRVVPAGWDSWNATARGTYNYTDFTMNRNGTLVNYTNAYQTDTFTRISKRLIDQWAPQRKPFFLWLNHVAPHRARRASGMGPALPAPRHAGLFADLVPPSFADPAFDEEDVSDKPAYVQAHPRLTPEAVDALRADGRGRAQSLQAVDESVATLVDALRSHGELRNTLLLFTSDNGYQLGEHRLHLKNYPYEQSLRVPLLVRGPGVPAGVQRHQRFSTVDLAATIAAVARARSYAQRTLDGRSLMPAATTDQGLGYDSTLIQAGSNDTTRLWSWRGVRTDRYTYVRNVATNEIELYDRQLDPHELVSVHDDPRYAGVLSVLAGHLQQRQTCRGTGCQASLPVPPAPGT